MGKSKLKSSRLIGIVVILCVICILGSLVVMSRDKYLYANNLNQILGLEHVAIEDKKLADSWAVGEWYICESYRLDSASIRSFLSITAPKNNFYLSDNKWKRVNWEKLPVKDAYSDIVSMIVNYAANASVNKTINDIKNVLTFNNGYYSFLAQPSASNPEKILFCLLDIKGRCLYVVDLKL